MERHEHALLGGFHIEESIYGPRYYYPEVRISVRSHLRQTEAKFPEDTVLLLLTAGPDTIRERTMSAAHADPVVKPQDVEQICQEFEREYSSSWIRRKLEIDTSDTTPDELFFTFKKNVVTVLDINDLLRWQALGQL